MLSTTAAEVGDIIGALEEALGYPAALTHEDLERLLVAARKLRWVRRAVHDDRAWGVAMGRLRRALPRLGPRIRDVLDHRTKPPLTWAALVAAPPEAAEHGEERAEVLRAELVTARTTPEGLLAWLVRAFDVLNTPELVALMLPLKRELDGFDEETLNHPDRRVRRRLRELVKRVAEATEEKPADSRVEPVAAADVASDDTITPHALDELAARVRRVTDGRRALFVSNREDPELGARLSELLGLRITWCDGSLRRVQAQCERIKGSSYDLILSATGFQVHGVDGALVRAANTASIPYVRVNRGRPATCVQAIAREFGLASRSERDELQRAARK
jgi:hypothetical protein